MSLCSVFATVSQIRGGFATVFGQYWQLSGVARRSLGSELPLSKTGAPRHGQMGGAGAPCGQRGGPHEALRQAGVDDIAAAKTVTLEPSGKVTVLKGDPPRPAEY